MKVNAPISITCPECGTALMLEHGFSDSTSLACPVCDRQLFPDPIPVRASAPVENATEPEPTETIIPPPLPTYEHRKSKMTALVTTFASIAVVAFAGYMILGKRATPRLADATSSAQTTTTEEPARTPPSQDIEDEARPVTTETAENPPPATPSASAEATAETPEAKPEKKTRKSIPVSPPVQTPPSKEQTAKAVYEKIIKPEAIPASLARRVEFLQNWQRILALVRGGQAIRNETVLTRSAGPLWMNLSDIGKVKVEEQGVYMSVAGNNDRIDIYPLSREEKERLPGSTPVISLQISRGNYTTDDKIVISSFRHSQAAADARLPSLFAVTEIIVGGMLFSTKDSWEAIITDLDKELSQMPVDICLNGDRALVVYRPSQFEKELLKDNKLTISILGCEPLSLAASATGNSHEISPRVQHGTSVTQHSQASYARTTKPRPILQTPASRARANRSSRSGTSYSPPSRRPTSTPQYDSNVPREPPASSRQTTDFRTVSRNTSSTTNDFRELNFRSREIDAAAAAIVAAVIALKDKAVTLQRETSSSQSGEEAAKYFKRAIHAETERLRSALGIEPGNATFERCLEALLARTWKIDTLAHIDSACDGAVVKKLKTCNLKVIRRVK